MSDLNVFRSRHSVREYAREALSRSTVETLIEAATLAPSAMNGQPWHFTVIQDRALLQTISDRAKAHLLATEQALPGDAKRMLEGQTYNVFYNAPVLIVISAPEQSPWAVEDCALAAENLMLAAAAEGLGSCWIGFAQRLLATAVGASLIGLPSGFRCVAPIIVGKPAVTPSPVARRPATIHWIG
jgi:nitroreductase